MRVPIVEEETSVNTGFVERPDGELYLATGTKTDAMFRRKRTGLLAGTSPPEVVDAVPGDAYQLHNLPEDPISRGLLQLGLPRLLTEFDEDISGLSGCRVDLKSYQLRPLLRYLDNPNRRLLIADEAGLGKTVEAAYILLEEMKRSNLDRVIVFAPSRLIDKWRWELRYRFGLFFEQMSGRGLEEALSSPESSFHALVSVDAMRGSESALRRALEEAEPVDMVIMDEVHHLIGRSGFTLRRELGLGLSMLADRVVGLSATPVGIEEDDLLRVMQVIDPVRFDGEQGRRILEVHTTLTQVRHALLKGDETQLSDQGRSLRGFLSSANGDDETPIPRAEDIEEMVQSLEKGPPSTKEERERLADRVLEVSPLNPWMTRTTRKQVGEDRERKLRTEKIELPRTETAVWVDGEKRNVSPAGLFEELQDLIKGWFSYSHLRQLSSSPSAMEGLLAAGAQGAKRWDADIQEQTGWASEPEPKDPELPERVQNRCSQLLSMMRAASLDPKIERLSSILKDLREDDSVRKALIFTQWLPTLEALRGQGTRLIDSPTYFLSGSDGDRVRQETVEAFSSGDEFKVLIATDILSEGLDLVAADAVINYDLPLNPQKVEQRIGRIDRIGQRSGTVQVVNLLIEGSEDERILEKLHERVEAFQRTIGPAADLLEEIEGSGRAPTDEELDEIKDAVEKEIEHLEGSLEIYDEDIADDADALTAGGQSFGPTVVRAAFARFHELLCGTSPDLGHSSAPVPELPEGVIDELNRLATQDKDPRIADQLRALSESEEHLSFEPEGDGIFLPHRHPLIQAVLRTVDRSLGELTEPLSLVAEGPGEPRVLLGMEAAFTLGEGVDRRWFFVEATSPDAIEEVDPGEAIRLFDNLVNGTTKELPGVSDHGVARGLLSERASDWLGSRIQQEVNRSIAQLKHRWGRLKRRMERTEDPSAEAELEAELDEVGAQLDDARELASNPREHIQSRERLLVHLEII